MLTKKTHVPYWEDFATFQTFNSVDEMVDVVKQFCSTYELTDSMQAVLNTIKLHAKNFVGVCWLYREEIAKKAKVSLSSVDRAVNALKEIGLLTVINKMHTKRGGKTHNLYVINNPVDSVDNFSSEPSSDPSFEEFNDASMPTEKEPINPCPTMDSDVVESPYKNFHKDSNTNLNKKNNSIIVDKVNDDILKYVPEEFVEIMKPYYDNSPEVIVARWKTTCIAIKKNCFGIQNTSWETIKEAWNLTVNRYKRNKIRENNDDGLGGYYYRTLSELTAFDYLKSHGYWSNFPSAN